MDVTRKKRRLDGVSVVARPNPYGVVPCGNLLLLEDAERGATLWRQRRSFGRLWRISMAESDASANVAILNALGYLEGDDLGRFQLSSRASYVLATSPELWRDVCLRRSGPIVYFGSWKASFCRREHSSLRLRLFHNGLHRLWCCGNFELLPHWFTHEDVPKVHADGLSVDRFIETYEKPNRPVVIKGLIDSWPARRKWKEDAYLIAACGDAELRATSPAAPMAVRFKMREYLKYCRGPPQEEAPLYVFERDFVQLCPALNDDFHAPKYFDPFYHEPGERPLEKPRPTDLFRLYGEERRPDHRWLIIGSKLSGSVFHIDPNSTNAWNACIRGRKRWILYPPGKEPPPGVIPSGDGADVTLPLGLGEWFLSFWPYHDQRRSHPDPGMRPLEITVEEGETIFVPHGWWHLVLNIDEVCVAITQNYVSSSNLANVMSFLRDKEDQISGIRDRLQDGEEVEKAVPTLSVSAVRPEMMHKELEEALLKNYAELLQPAPKDRPPGAQVAKTDSEVTRPNKISHLWNSVRQVESEEFSFEFSM